MIRNTAVIFDACVLYPAPLRDLLIQLAAYGQNKHWFRAKWTEQIHEEWIENLLKTRTDIKRSTLHRTRDLMNNAIDDCLVEGYEPLISSLDLLDADDRHVLAAAIHSKSTVIVTANTRDFPAAKLDPYDVQAMTADDFICSLIDEFGDEGAIGLGFIVNLIKTRLSNPPVTWSEYLETLTTLSGNELPNTATMIREVITDAVIAADKTPRDNRS